MAEHILIERRGDVLVLTLNRPDRLNAAPPAMFEEITAALNTLEGARAVLLAGAGRAFCSGADVGGGALNAADPGEATHAALTGSYNPALATIASLGVPVVSAVRGAAAGIGCSLALAADLCVASETAYFLQAFVNIGLVPDGGASWMLPRLVGRARAAEMMLLGERVPAAKALDWGMIHSVVADDALDATAFALAERLAAGPTVALGLMRQGLHRALEEEYAAAMEREARDQRTARRSADSAEGGRAFLEKRAPRFTGA
ncbi:enoyl-CoA hydratase-related protein [Sphingomonas aracearum]|uniref:2-(1,2-epoxy-1,2-dihydrophenyl)acetyl-CoA isomerase n=1 Tax=Sphingomonas aracearum TaxID=2283317 RepID=A0A369W174_9SPHN|nr:enoyl-CoA hydratase-related protein [Sphingomonas aracearum]RDE05831.1 2-(1,2-epoxy-1,2-dihydrophenyl)acetyl-CoA isomerase [Sphingomonas aracearum]